MAEYNVFKRYKKDELQEDYNKFDFESPVVKGLNLVNSMILILNETRQIIFANKAIINKFGYARLDELLGRRPGEIVNCIHHKENALGCGTSSSCENCNALNVVLRTMKNHEQVTDLARIVTEHIHGVLPMDIEISSETYEVNGHTYIIVNMHDLNKEIRKEEMERIFYHDILNSAGGIRGILQLITEEMPTEVEEDFKFATLALKDLIEAIEFQRKMSLQHDGFIDFKLELIDSMELLNEMKTFFIKMGAITPNRIKIDVNSNSVELETDIVVLRRILHNMIKNGIEAKSNVGTITIGCDSLDDGWIDLWVHNSEYIDPETAKQIFNNRVSTKGNNRGWGTFSMKLLGENFLNGKVDFKSDKLNGTKFYIQIPVTKVEEL